MVGVLAWRRGSGGFPLGLLHGCLVSVVEGEECHLELDSSWQVLSNMMLV